MACLRAINEFAKEVGISGLVVCSRLKEYNALAIRLKVGAAIYLQPLTSAQIYTYLHQAGPDLAILRTALQQDPVLQTLAQSPLMLGIMRAAYQGLPASA